LVSTLEGKEVKGLQEKNAKGKEYLPVGFLLYGGKGPRKRGDFLYYFLQGNKKENPMEEKVTQNTYANCGKMKDLHWGEERERLLHPR